MAAAVGPGVIPLATATDHRRRIARRPASRAVAPAEQHAAMSLPQPSPSPAIAPDEHIAACLAERGWCVHDAFVADHLVHRLADEATAQFLAGDFRPAAIGRGNERRLHPEIRNDRVQWLDPADCSLAQAAWLARLEQLRLTLNRQLQLGLFDYEGHLAVYPPGSYYRRHSDRFQGIGRRTVTVILYLNAEWDVADGGQLRIYTDPLDGQHHHDVLPLGGRLACFLSSDFEHEVLPATRDRLSLTGWFRTRT